MKQLIGFLPTNAKQQHFRTKNLTGDVIEIKKDTVFVLFNIIENKEHSEILVSYPIDECDEHFTTTKTVHGITFREFCNQLDFVPHGKTKWELFWTGYKQ